MPPTATSKQAIFRAVAQSSHHEWPAYDLTQLYDRSSLAALEEDIVMFQIEYYTFSPIHRHHA